jgi:RNA-directed DNA polymerase
MYSFLSDKYLNINNLHYIFESKVQLKSIKGIDRINSSQFIKDRYKYIQNLQTIHRKCSNGTYKFSPYLELLHSKGRNKNPRIIALQTVRDRIVLYVLKEILYKLFPECVSRQLANTYIHEVKKFLEVASLDELKIFRTDIQNFYSSIDRKILLNKLEVRI